MRQDVEENCINEEGPGVTPTRSGDEKKKKNKKTNKNSKSINYPMLNWVASNGVQIGCYLLSQGWDRASVMRLVSDRRAGGGLWFAALLRFYWRRPSWEAIFFVYKIQTTETLPSYTSQRGLIFIIPILDAQRLAPQG